ncbi:MAG: (2Fe-2S)-binding protein [Clostridiales bacterium]|nr:(2Fe-2S)-binding protein [Clostridiales bacterium]
MIEYNDYQKVYLNINGENRSVIIKPAQTLLDVLRSLGLTGAKKGCENGDCGSCTVLINSYPIKSCLTLALEAVGKQILTIEGLKNSPFQQAFVSHNAFQCGYCTPGFLLVCHSLSIHYPNADDQTIAHWLQSNICRCTCYQEITNAVKCKLKDILQTKKA